MLMDKLRELKKNVSTEREYTRDHATATRGHKKELSVDQKKELTIMIFFF